MVWGKEKDMVKIRFSKQRKCTSCESNGGKFYDLGFGIRNGKLTIICLCDTCMHELLQKMVVMGGRKDEV